MKKDKTLRLSNFLKEGLEDLETNLPTQVDKFLEKLIQQLRSYNMNRSKKALIIAKIIDGLGMDKQQVMQSIQKIKQSGALAEGESDKSTKLKSLINPSLSEAKFGTYMSRMSLDIIAKSLKDTKLISPDKISKLENKKDETAINNILVNDASKIIKSLKRNGRQYLHPMYLDDLIRDIKKLESGEYEFVNLDEVKLIRLKDIINEDFEKAKASIQKIKQSGALAENQNNKSTKLKSLIKPSLNEAKKANIINLESIGLTEHSIDFNIDDVIKECDKLKVFLQKRKKAGDTFARVSSKSYREQTIYTMNTSVDN